MIYGSYDPARGKIRDDRFADLSKCIIGYYAGFYKLLQIVEPVVG